MAACHVPPVFGFTVSPASSAWALVALAWVAGCAPIAEPPPLDPAPPPAPSAEIRIAGAEAATPLVRHLAELFQSRQPGPPVVVEEPLGDAGARAALADGRIAAALVVTPGGAGEGVVLARSAVVLAVGPGVRARRITAAVLAESLRGERAVWGGGLPRRVLLRPVDDPIQAALVAAVPGLDAPLAAAVAGRRWPVYGREGALRSALRAPGALAVADRGNLRLHGVPAWEVAIDGVAPVHVDVRLIAGEPMPPRLRAFVAFAASADGGALVGDLGFEPVGRGEASP